MINDETVKRSGWHSCASSPPLSLTASTSLVYLWREAASWLSRYQTTPVSAARLTNICVATLRGHRRREEVEEVKRGDNDPSKHRLTERKDKQPTNLRRAKEDGVNKIRLERFVRIGKVRKKRLYKKKTET